MTAEQDSSTVVLTCPACGQRSRAHPGAVIVRCPSCSQPITVPNA